MEKSITNVVILLFEVNGFKNIYSKWLIDINMKEYIVIIDCFCSIHKIVI
jgi:hypothetical protein